MPTPVELLVGLMLVTVGEVPEDPLPV